MSKVRDFYLQLPNAEKDLFAAMANGMVNSAPPEKLERLRVFHGQLKQEIDEINRRRQALGAELNNIETMVRDIDRFVEKTGDSLNIQLFKAQLVETAEQIREEVAALKPEEKLAKKHDLAKKLTMLTQRRAVAQNLLREVVNGRGDEDGRDKQS